MKTKSEIDKSFAARAAAVSAENLLPAVLAGTEQADGAASGMSPAEIMRGLQERQAAGVLTATMPGPQAWGAYETPLPGGVQDGQGQAVKGNAVTPAHSAAEGAMEADAAGHEDAERRRRRVQHEADPYPPEIPKVAHVDVPKAYRQAVDVPEGYPAFRQVHAEEFRRPPAEGRAAYSPGYGPPARPVPVPSAALAPGMVTRPALTDGHARPGVPREAG